MYGDYGGDFIAGTDGNDVLVGETGNVAGHAEPRGERQIVAGIHDRICPKTQTSLVGVVHQEERDPGR